MPFKKNYTYDESDSSYSDLLRELDTDNVQSLFFYPRRREVDVIFKNGDKEITLVSAPQNWAPSEEPRETATVRSMTIGAARSPHLLVSFYETLEN